MTARLIPARGETTRLSRGSWASRRAHPRSRGDDARRSSVTTCPRGLIPARAETTRYGVEVARTPRAHPRSRGDDIVIVAAVAGVGGSSPLAGRRLLAGVLLAVVLLAHPRSRGDDAPRVSLTMPQAGSSPLAGRRPPVVRRLPGDRGLIPARGETTGAVQPIDPLAAAHPRSRGDDWHVVVADLAQHGSSPLAGRRPDRTPGARGVSGLIPARGETTWSWRPSSSASRAHPRSRGDDSASTSPSFTVPGSSPLAGRRPPVGEHPVAQARLIPARGETTRAWWGRTREPQAHPRSRGDDMTGSVTRLSREGSSPLAGRRHRAHRRECLHGGLIPARGETTPRQARRSVRRTAHPRSRGDDTACRSRSTDVAGSSPLAGRRRRQQRRDGCVVRLIPARGETTSRRTSPLRTTPAHPRSRGDDNLKRVEG